MRLVRILQPQNVPRLFLFFYQFQPHSYKVCSYKSCTCEHHWKATLAFFTNSEAYTFYTFIVPPQIALGSIYKCEKKILLFLPVFWLDIWEVKNGKGAVALKCCLKTVLENFREFLEKHLWLWIFFKTVAGSGTDSWLSFFSYPEK